METLKAAALDLLKSIHNAVRDTVRDLPPEALDWRPADETNSIYVLVTHMVGAERYWLSAAGGETAPRDRAAEFKAHGGDASTVLRLLDEADARNRDLVERLTPDSLAATFTGRDPHRSGGWCFVHAVEHSAEHRGQITLTRQLWEKSVGRGGRQLMVGSVQHGHPELST